MEYLPVTEVVVDACLTLSVLLPCFNNNYFLFIERKKFSYKITILCIPFKIFDQLTDFYETSCGRYATGENPNVVHFKVFTTLWREPG
jgi:hypothetical protein